MWGAGLRAATLCWTILCTRSSCVIPVARAHSRCPWLSVCGCVAVWLCMCLGCGVGMRGSVGGMTMGGFFGERGGDNHEKQATAWV